MIEEVDERLETFKVHHITNSPFNKNESLSG